MNGLSAAGGMMRYVGFAILLRIMLSKDLWGIYFAGSALATIIASITSGWFSIIACSHDWYRYCYQ